ncbi:MAG TPA: sarcosine oxidase subunit gamma family protein, partial [Solirubrobacteraceae bacterium]|nr:sarcosine oxidase subunit gamma family protein [Solirubrobacteraceae bacterium]
MADLGPTSPLAVMSAAFSEACAQSDGVLGIQERPFAAQVTLRIDPDSATGLAVADALSLRLPVSPCTVAGGESLEALWLGPDEWLLVSFEQTAGAIERTVRSVTARGTDDPVAVVDVSAQRTIVELSGPAVRTVLARGCALDLHESVFSAGCCAQTLLAQAPVILQPTDTD